jgi:hypothetical protein
VISWWNWISLVLTVEPRALGQRSADAVLSSANLVWTVSPYSFFGERAALEQADRVVDVVGQEARARLLAVVLGSTGPSRPVRRIV